MMDDPSVTGSSGATAVCYHRSTSAPYGSTTGSAGLGNNDPEHNDEQTSLLNNNMSTDRTSTRSTGIRRSCRRSNSGNNGRRKKRLLVAVGLGVVLALVALLGSAVLTDSDYDEEDRMLEYYVDDDYEYDDDRTSSFGSSWTKTTRTMRNQLGMLIPLLASARTTAQREAKQAQLNNLSDPPKDLLMGRANAYRDGKLIDNYVPDADIGCEATFVLVRHCEKGGIREHCDYPGYERAQYLASLFGHDESSRWPAPKYVYAESPSQRRNPRKHNYRELETVLPLATKFGVTVNTDYSTLDTHEFAGMLHRQLREGDLCGHVVVISWKHSKLPRLASALGCGPREGCPAHYRSSEFDQAWQIKFVNRKPSHEESKHLATPKRQQWLVFGSVQRENFDPLEFSKRVGDYPKGGTPHGGRWIEQDVQVPDRFDDLLPSAVAIEKNKHGHKNRGYRQ